MEMNCGYENSGIVEASRCRLGSGNPPPSQSESLEQCSQSMMSSYAIPQTIGLRVE
jgi:hypothetical protein